MTIKDARARRTREKLHRAFLQLLETHPLQEMTIRQITAAAKVGYNTFFRHYSTKDALLRDIAEDQIEQLVAMSLPVFREPSDIRNSTEALLDYVERHRKLWKILLTGGAASVMREAFHQRSIAIAHARGQGKDWLPMEIGTLLAVTGIFEVITWWLRQTDPMPVAELADILDRALLSAITAREGH